MTLVSIGIPTYNRASKLRRAAESVLNQPHRELALVIYDNASSDDTAALCAELCAADARVRYLRAPVNRGPTANFNVLYEAVTGEFAMMLSDDDWLEPTYVERCLEALVAEPSRSLVCGRARYFAGDRVARLGAPITLESPDAGRRVVDYLESVDENGLFYGLARRETLRAAAPLRNVLGNDWLLVAGMLMAGAAATIETTAINREVGGTSADFRRLAATLDLPRIQARAPHVVIAWQVLAEILWRAPAFRTLATGERAILAGRAASTVLDWRSDAWHATAPTAAALGRRRGGAPLWRAYLRITARLGATHERLPDEPTS